MTEDLNNLNFPNYLLGLREMVLKWQVLFFSNRILSVGSVLALFSFKF